MKSGQQLDLANDSGLVRLRRSNFRIARPKSSDKEFAVRLLWAHGLVVFALVFLTLPVSAQSSTNEDAVSREVSIFNFGASSSSSDAVSREISVFNNGQPYAPVEAISREVSIYKIYHEPPVLPVVPNQTVSELTLLTVLDPATEPNTNAATAGYELVNSPTGMVINSNGIITWTPSQTQSPGTNVVTIVVSNSDPFDAVHPYLGATNSFTVIVKEVNVMPFLPIIATQTVNKLALLTVNNAASESNIHALLAYALIAAPSGMNISTNGIITWTPSNTQSPSTNTITTVVTATDLFDTVNPHLSATNKFTVIVAPGLLIGAPLWEENGEFQFSFNTETGTTYVVQYSVNLSDWISIEEVDGSGGAVTVIDPFADSSDEGFYRVMIANP